MAIELHKRGVDPVLNEETAAAALGMSRKTLRRLVERGDGPPRLRLTERLIGYRTSALVTPAPSRSTF
jgi:predicted DNA-binding transcriptional regulator AlpA